MVILATFIIFPLAGGAEAILILRSDASLPIKLVVAATWAIMTIPLLVIVTLLIRQRWQQRG